MPGPPRSSPRLHRSLAFGDLRNRIASLTLLVSLYLSDLATHYYDREILAKDRARPWQAVLYATNRNIDLLWHYSRGPPTKSLAAGPHQVLREVGESPRRTSRWRPTTRNHRLGVKDYEHERVGTSVFVFCEPLGAWQRAKILS